MNSHEIGLTIINILPILFLLSSQYYFCVGGRRLEAGVEVKSRHIISP